MPIFIRIYGRIPIEQLNFWDVWFNIVYDIIVRLLEKLFQKSRAIDNLIVVSSIILKYFKTSMQFFSIEEIGIFIIHNILIRITIMLKPAFVAIDQEKSLLKAISEGNHQSFEQLFLFYIRPLGNYIFRLIEDEQLTNDLLQDIFLGIWQDKEKLIDILDFKNYLFIISRNRVYNALKIKAKHAIMFQSIESNEELVRNLVEDDEEVLHADRFYTLFEQELNKLPLQQQKIFRLCKLKKMKYEHVAQLLGISVETVRKHMYLANKKLKEVLRGKEGELFLFILSVVYFKNF